MRRPRRAEHPIPFVIAHWINLLAILALALSGLYIHFPPFGGLMGLARATHFVCMFVVLVNLAVRVILSFFVVDTLVPATGAIGRDFRNFLPQPENRHQLWPWIKYYLLLKKDVPISAKYGVLQKVAYFGTIPLTLLAAYTGFALWGPTQGWPMFRIGADWVATLWNSGNGGDPMNMRILHFWIMWAVGIFAATHVYLATIHGLAPARLILFWQETDEDTSAGLG